MARKIPSREVGETFSENGIETIVLAKFNFHDEDHMVLGSVNYGLHLVEIVEVAGVQHGTLP